MKNFKHSIYKVPRPASTPIFKYGFKGGFTIVETLVAVAILMIAVAGPLVVATKGLTAALASKDQMIASYLAQDTMETIKNVRDNNLAYGNDWLAGIYVDGSSCDFDSRGCDVNGIDPINIYKCPSSIQCVIPIYYNSSTGYTHSAGSSPTIFSRHFYFEKQATPGGADLEVIAHVIVDWKEGTVPYQVHLTSQLVETTR